MNNLITWARKPDFVSTTVGENIVILHLESGRYYSFGETAAAIWEFLDSPKSEDGIVNWLIRVFDVSKDACSISVANFLNELNTKGLIVRQ